MDSRASAETAECDVIRILHASSLYPPASVGGAERVAAMLAEAQAAAGHEVIATSLTRTPQPPGEVHGVTTRSLHARNPLWIEDSARFPSPVRLANKAATVFNVVTAAEFGRLLDEVKPDVLHTHSMVELPPALWARAKARGVPVVHTLHDYDLLCIRAALYKDGQRCAPRHLACRILSAPKQAAHRHIDVVAAVSGVVLERHLEHSLFDHLDADRRHVVWNPVASGRAAEREGRGSGAPFRFGFLGRLVAQKGVGLLVAACRQLPAEGWVLDIAGAGPEEAEFRAAAEGLPIRFLGHVDAPSFLAGVDALVVAPTWDEPFGLTTLEAYAAGCRVIGARAGVTGDLVDRIDPGWTFPSGDRNGLAEAMVRAMAATDRVSAERAAATLDDLTAAKVAKTYVTLYEQARRIAGAVDGIY